MPWWQVGGLGVQHTHLKKTECPPPLSSASSARVKDQMLRFTEVRLPRRTAEKSRFFSALASGASCGRNSLGSPQKSQVVGGVVPASVYWRLCSHNPSLSDGIVLERLPGEAECITSNVAQVAAERNGAYAAREASSTGHPANPVWAVRGQAACRAANRVNDERASTTGERDEKTGARRL